MDLTSSQKKLEALDDVVEELPVAPSLGAFLKYLDVRTIATAHSMRRDKRATRFHALHPTPRRRATPTRVSGVPSGHGFRTSRCERS